MPNLQPTAVDDSGLDNCKLMPNPSGVDDWLWSHVTNNLHWSSCSQETPLTCCMSATLVHSCTNSCLQWSQRPWYSIYCSTCPVIQWELSVIGAQLTSYIYGQVHSSTLYFCFTLMKSPCLQAQKLCCTQTALALFPGLQHLHFLVAFVCKNRGRRPTKPCTRLIAHSVLATKTGQVPAESYTEPIKHAKDPMGCWVTSMKMFSNDMVLWGKKMALFRVAPPVTAVPQQWNVDVFHLVIWPTWFCLAWSTSDWKLWTCSHFSDLSFCYVIS